MPKSSSPKPFTPPPGWNPSSTGGLPPGATRLPEIDRTESQDLLVKEVQLEEQIKELQAALMEVRRRLDQSRAKETAQENAMLRPAGPPQAPQVQAHSMDFGSLRNRGVNLK